MGFPIPAFDPDQVGTPNISADGAGNVIINVPAGANLKIQQAGQALTNVLAGALTVSAGGANITGNSSITGTLTTSGALTVSGGGAAITGNSTLAGTLTLSGSNSIFVAAGQGLDTAAAGALILGATNASTVQIQPTTAGNVDFHYAGSATGGSASPTLGTNFTGGSAAPQTAAQNGWLKVLVNGTASYIPFWR